MWLRACGLSARLACATCRPTARQQQKGQRVSPLPCSPTQHTILIGSSSPLHRSPLSCRSPARHFLPKGSMPRKPASGLPAGALGSSSSSSTTTCRRCMHAYRGELMTRVSPCCLTHTMLLARGGRRTEAEAWSRHAAWGRLLHTAIACPATVRRVTAWVPRAAHAMPCPSLMGHAVQHKRLYTKQGGPCGAA